MKKLYILPALILLCWGVLHAQNESEKALVFGNQLFLENNNADIAFQTPDHKGGPAWSPNIISHQKLVEREMAGYRQWATLNVPATGTEYDARYYRLELRINPDTSVGKYIRGKVTTYFTTTQSNFNIIKFDFASPLGCDSVYYHGAKLAAGNISRPTDLLQITIPTIVTTGTLDSVSVYYKGVPPVVPFFGNGTGYVKSTHNAGTKNYVYTLSEPYSSYTWWPCKSFIANDKADSLDLVVSTPIAFKVAGNGTLVSETTNGSNLTTYWKHRYPIAAYQVCIAVANFVQYPASPTIVNIGGTNMPLYNYLFPETNTATAQATLDRTALMLTTFSSKFGDYPFKKEKYGHYTFGFGGGMEHNTFSGMHPGTYDDAGDWDIIAHELGHQWFGANVTCASWGEIWINESFATFAESVCAEFSPSVTAGQTGVGQRAYHKSQAISTSNQTQSVYVNDTSDMATIFTPAVYVYERGAMVIYMLRTLLGDTKFFQAIKNLQADPLLKYGNAVTADIKRHMENASGLDLTTFFNQWIYNTGFANYNNAKWNNSGTQLILQLPQTTQLSPVAHFDMPVVVRIQGSVPAQDTTVVLYDNNGILHYADNGILYSAGGNIVQFNLSFIPVTITFDPFAQVLANGSFAKDPLLIVLAASQVNFKGKKEGNDVILFWSADQASDYTLFEIEKSNDGTSYETIGMIHTKDFAGTNNFSYNHNSNITSAEYYRVKIIKKNGSVFYTKTLLLGGSTADTYYTISPNPANDYVLIKSNVVKEKVTIKFYDASGKMVKKLLKQTLTNNSHLKIPVDELTAGNYFIEIGSSTGRNTKQFVIIK